MHHQFDIQQLYTVFMCFVFIWEQTATCATYSINWLVFITEMKSVYSAVRTGSLNKAVYASSLKGHWTVSLGPWYRDSNPVTLWLACLWQRFSLYPASFHLWTVEVNSITREDSSFSPFLLKNIRTVHKYRIQLSCYKFKSRTHPTHYNLCVWKSVGK